MRSLYNGIVLSEDWPPRRTREDLLAFEPMRVPYLENPPEVIPIDLGRQLFVDDFLIENTTLRRTFHRAAILGGKSDSQIREAMGIYLSSSHCYGFQRWYFLRCRGGDISDVVQGGKYDVHRHFRGWDALGAPGTGFYAGDEYHLSVW